MYKQINVTDLSSEDLYLLMEEILSDVSEISEGENKSNEMGVELHPNVNMNYFSNDEAAINNVAWESEDELPLTAFIATKAQKTGASLYLKEFKIAVATGLIGANPTMPQMGR
ncbi:cubilin [Holotrichia oblita]|uniref:Cubilin n=1 Tax=Holotrichia oblita TaxID=644536 RepID=A0ACB9SQ34_HOLOL|nr:cubilin [Holotrichia oblita]